MLAAEASSQSIESFLAENERKELLRFSTAGSVDDGKSTLIGRLLYDSKGVYEDQLASVKKASVNRSAGAIDFSLLTDGLRAEREQGITIDVAYRYFATPRRKFIIADTPGHEQYTRNMATGASTAELAVVLVDARKGVLPQSRRHAFIASLLGIRRIVVAVNKMDLVDYSREVFDQVCADFLKFSENLNGADIHFIPVSALEGDNVVHASKKMPWFDGGSLLEYLETVPVARDDHAAPMRFPVQYVIRPTADFRGFAGQLSSGLLKPGDPVMALPGGRTTRVSSIVTYDGDCDQAFPPMSVTVCLEDEIDISRGDMLVDPTRMPHVSRRLAATLVWMHDTPLKTDYGYLLKHTTVQVRATITAVTHRVDIGTMERQTAAELRLNEIGDVRLETSRPLFYDPYRWNRFTGSLILIDPASNATVAAGMILESATERRLAPSRDLTGVEFETSRVTPAERFTRAGHGPATVWLTSRKDLAYVVERVLFDRGCLAHVLADEAESHALAELACVLNAAGIIAICSISSTESNERDHSRNLIGADRFVEIDPRTLSPRDSEAADQIVWALEDRGILPASERFSGGEGI
jgi:sulfate adenylyltransferase large subunit